MQSDPSAPIVFDRAAGFYDETRGFPTSVDTRVAALFAQAGRLGPASRVLEVGVLHGADEQNEFWRALRRRFDEGVGYEHAGVPRARFETFPEDEGFPLVEPVHRIEFAQRVTPQELLDRFAKRTWSVTWQVSDEQLARAVEALRSELSETSGVLDRSVELPMGFWVRAYRPPA
jgi:hypothetical protein